MTAPSDLKGLISSNLRSAMLRFARLHLHPLEEAEDAVQDALIVLCECADRIQTTADPKRYVFGVLKNKITDRLRRKYRHAAYSQGKNDDEELDALLFDESGHWAEDTTPAHWNTPENQLRNDQFFAVVDACINHLPSKTAQVFSMKEFLEFETEEICETLGLTKSDYWQCMSRARKQLQVCVNKQWFDGATL